MWKGKNIIGKIKDKTEKVLNLDKMTYLLEEVVLSSGIIIGVLAVILTIVTFMPTNKNNDKLFGYVVVVILIYMLIFLLFMSVLVFAFIICPKNKNDED